MQQFRDVIDVSALVNSLLLSVPNLLAALVIVVAGYVVVRLTRPPLRTALRRGDFAPALIELLVDSVYTSAMMVVAMLMAAGQLGINVTAALAGMGIVGIAVGFAAQDSLSNSIAGFLIFWDKPFKVGDFVSVQDEYGTVTEITLRTTRIRTRNNTYVIIPNKEIIDDVLVNHSMYGETRVDVAIGIAYKESIDDAREVLLAAVADLADVLDDPEPRVVVKGLGDSSVDLEVRVWVATADVERAVTFRTIEACKKALDDADIEIPFPHMQLYVDSVKREIFELASETIELQGTPQ